MNTPRRLFLNQLSLVAGLAALSKPLNSIAAVSKRISTLHNGENAVTIYHTNDLHGKFNSVYDNMGGIGHIKNLLSKQETSGLLLDAGDFVDGSHSLPQQRNVIYAMNQMGYHAAAVGNNELARGQEHLAALIPRMKFSLVNCNYGFDDVLSKLVKPYIIINSGKFKIGVTGVGQQLKGVEYKNAIQSANAVAAHLKNKEGCDLVICLSHLGYSQDGDTPDNQKLAKQSENIDLIIGGHNRTLLTGPVIKLNKLKHEVIVTHAAWDGLMLGKAVFCYEGSKKKVNIKAKNFIPGQPLAGNFADSFANLTSIDKSAVPA